MLTCLFLRILILKRQLRDFLLQGASHLILPFCLFSPHKGHFQFRSCLSATFAARRVILQRTADCRAGLVGEEPTHHLQRMKFVMCAAEEVILLLFARRRVYCPVLRLAKPLSDPRGVRLFSTLVQCPTALPSDSMCLVLGIARVLATFAEKQVTWQRTAGNSSYLM